ncbi:hypothetical protein ABFX02_14G132100 [Erythranthe guttata]
MEECKEDDENEEDSENDEEEKEEGDNEKEKEEEESLNKQEIRSKRRYDSSIVRNVQNRNDRKEKTRAEGFVTPPALSRSPRKKIRVIARKYGRGRRKKHRDIAVKLLYKKHHKRELLYGCGSSTHCVRIVES